MPRSAAMTALAVALVNELGSEPGREWLTPLKEAVAHFEKSPPPTGDFAVAADHLEAACDLALNQVAAKLGLEHGSFTLPPHATLAVRARRARLTHSRRAARRGRVSSGCSRSLSVRP